MTRFATGFLSVAGGNYGAIALSFAINLVLTRALGTQEFGRLALLIMGSQILAFAVANWTLTALVHFGAQEFAVRGSVGRTFWSRVCVLLPWTAAAAGIAVVLNPWLAGYLGVPRWGVWLVFLHFLLTATLNTAGAVLQAIGRLERYGAALFFDKALTLAVILVVLPARSLDALTALACYTLSALVVSGWVFGSVAWRAVTPPAPTYAGCLTMWKFSLPLIASTWVGLFGTQWVDYVFIKHYLPLSELGRYSLSYQLAGVVQQITIVASTLLLPRFSTMLALGREAELRRLVTRAVPYWLLALSAFLGVVLAGAGVLVPVVFGPGFVGSVPPLALLIVATIALAMFNTFTPLLTAQGATWTISGICLLSAAVNVVMNVTLIPRFGITGAAGASVIAYAVSAGLVLAAVQVRLHAASTRYGLFAAPVVAVYVCSVLIEGVAFFVAAAAALAVTAFALVRTFRLFEPSDIALFSDVDLPPWLRSGLSKVFSLRGGVT